MSEDETKKPATLRDIARVCGVTVPTVSRALSMPGRHSPELTARIRAAAEELGYDPALHSDARRLSLKRYGKTAANHLVAFLLPQYFHQSPFFYDVFAGVMDVMASRGYGVIMLKGDKRSELPACVRRGEIDGAITACNDTPIMRRLLEEQMTRTVVSALEPFVDLPRAIPDFRAGGATLARHLIGRGYQRLIYLQKNMIYLERGGKYSWIFQGLQKETESEGQRNGVILHRLNAPRILWNHAHSIDRIGQQAEFDAIATECAPEILAAWKESKTRTVFVAANDAMATVLHRIFTSRGIRVPQDVGICGFDGMNPLAPAMDGRLLTTIHIPLHDCGKAAANLLLRLLAKSTQPAAEASPATDTDESAIPTVLVPVELIDGETT